MNAFACQRNGRRLRRAKRQTPNAKRQTPNEEQHAHGVLWRLAFGVWRLKFGRAQRPWKGGLPFAALAIVLLSVTASAQFSGRKFVLDPGHGGSDPGAVGIDGGVAPNEEDFVLDVALRLRTLLQNAGATVVMTRTTDTTVSLTARRDLTNAEDPDAFLSIHCNSFGDPIPHGTETFWWTSGNASDQALAGDVQSRMVAAFALTNRGVKQGNFHRAHCKPARLARRDDVHFQSGRVRPDEQSRHA